MRALDTSPTLGALHLCSAMQAPRSSPGSLLDHSQPHFSTGCILNPFLWIFSAEFLYPTQSKSGLPVQWLSRERGPTAGTAHSVTPASPLLNMCCQVWSADQEEGMGLDSQPKPSPTFYGKLLLLPQGLSWPRKLYRPRLNILKTTSVMVAGESSSYKVPIIWSANVHAFTEWYSFTLATSLVSLFRTFIFLTA